MSVFKCKMCGGTVVCEGDSKIGICDSCGTAQTVPVAAGPDMSGLYDRANMLRQAADFDKAADIFERIVEQDSTQAEAYWGLILCRYGVEYVSDPNTGMRLPTCHRACYEPVSSDPDYISAVQYADMSQKSMYEAEARTIDRIQKNILEIARKEQPFDVFICYKETDDSGIRTRDSVIANDIYYQLTEENYKVFFAPITLEDKLGQEYEPYIFSALNSAKVMLVIGTRPEYFSAVWVKNEWSRFLKLAKNDRSRLLIPCYRDMDPYDLPAEFSYLQAQDMGRIGFITDLIRGIKKVINKTPAAISANESNISITAAAYAQAPLTSVLNVPKEAQTFTGYTEKQKAVFDIIDAFRKENSDSDNCQLAPDPSSELLRKQLLKEKASLPAFPAVALVFMCIGLCCYIIPGLIPMFIFIHKVKKFKRGRIRAAEIDKMLSELKQGGESEYKVSVYSYIRDRMTNRGYQVSDDEISYCLIIKKEFSSPVVYGSVNGIDISWEPVCEDGNVLTLVSRYALVSGSYEYCSRLRVNFPIMPFGGLTFSDARIPSREDYSKMKHETAKCTLKSSGRGAWWRLSDRLSGSNPVDVDPSGYLNTKGHLPVDERIYFRPVVDVTVLK